MRLALLARRHLALPSMLCTARTLSPPLLQRHIAKPPPHRLSTHPHLPRPHTNLRCSSNSVPIVPGSIAVESLPDTNGDTNGQGPSTATTPTPPPTAAPLSSSSSSSSSQQEPEANGVQGAAAASLPTPSSSSTAPKDSLAPPALGEASADLAKIMSLAVPLMLQNLFGYLLSIICTVSIGRLGAPQLAAAALANSLYVVTGWSMLMGLCSAMDTLCGQAYGAKDYRSLGQLLQRALLLCWLACLPVALLWANSASLMVTVMGQDPAIAAMAGRYLALCIPCIFLGIFADCIKKYLQAQGIVAPGMYATAAATLLAPLYFWGLVHQLGLGMDGAAAAYILCQLTTLVGLVGYLAWFTRREVRAGSRTNTWGGFSIAAATSNWGPYLRYGLPAMVMLSLDWWVYEGAVIMTGWLPNAQAALSVGGICMQINSWAYMVPMGLGSAVNTCVSNALGAGAGASARRAAALGLAAAAATQLAVVATVLGFGTHLIQLISPDPTVIALATNTLPVLCCLIFCDGLNAVLNGVLRGAGEQATGAAISTAYLCLALPLCYALTFLAPPALLVGLPLLGGAAMEPVARVWLGVGLGSLCQVVAQVLLVSRWDWDAKARQALQRVAATSSSSSSSK